MGKYQLVLDLNRNPDTELLAAMLRNEYEELMSADVGVELDDNSRASLVWYRIAELAKTLRA